MGDTAAFCDNCPWKAQCSGWPGCLGAEDHAYCKTCHYCCPADPDRFGSMVNEVGGLQLTDVRARQQPIPDLPRTVVKFRDGDNARRWPPEHVLATTLPAIINRQASVRSIREQNWVAPHSLLIIDGCCRDDVLEDLWLRRHTASLYRVLQAEAPCLIVAPDMSLYPEMSPCHKLYQIKRTFLMYEHFQQHGFATVPLLSPDAPAHARYLASWLRLNPCVTTVASSFQTLHKRKRLWLRHLRLLRLIQGSVPRQLVWMLIGQSDDPRHALEAQLGSVRFIVAGPKFRRMRHPRDASLQLPI